MLARSLALLWGQGVVNGSKGNVWAIWELPGMQISIYRATWCLRRGAKREMMHMKQVLRRVEWPTICWLDRARSPGLYCKLCQLITHGPRAVFSLWCLSLQTSLQSTLRYQSRTKKNTFALLMVYSVKRATRAPSLYLFWFPLRGGHGSCAVRVSTTGGWCASRCRACSDSSSHPEHELGVHVLQLF